MSDQDNGKPVDEAHVSPTVPERKREAADPQPAPQVSRGAKAVRYADETMTSDRTVGGYATKG